MLKTRLRNQRLIRSTLTDPVAVVRWMGAMQAQDYPGAKWGVGLRAKNVREADVDAAFDRGDLLRIHVLRPTWHFVTREDLRWTIALTGPRLQAINRPYVRKLGFDEKLFAAAQKIVERALAGETFLTRRELAGRFAKGRIAVRGQPLAHLLLELEARGVICSGPRRDGQFTYALVEERTPAASPVPREEALAMLAARFFRSHGPATIGDFSWWSGLTAKDARAAVAAAGVEPLAAPPGPYRAAGAHYLLPNYDEYLIAYKHRGAVIDPARARNLGVFTSLEYPHQVILDGRVAASWRRIVAASGVRLDVRPYGKLSQAQKTAVVRQSVRYGRFLRLPIEVRFDR